MPGEGQSGGGNRVDEPEVFELRVLRALHAVMTAVHASLDLQATLDAVTQGVTAASGFEVAALNLVVEGGGLEVVCVSGSEEAREALLGMRVPAENVRTLMAASKPWGRLRFLGHEFAVDGLVDNYWIPPIEAGEGPDAWHPEDTLFAPLTTPSGEWLGVLSVDAPRNGRRPDEQTTQVLELFGDHAAIAIELQRNRAALAHAATHDELTGLGNRALLAGYASVPASADDPFGVITIDLDRFKKVNDTHGHQAGDEVLRAVAERLRECVRPADVVIRTGGDEFVVLLHGLGTQEALPVISARLAEMIAEPIVTPGGVYQVGTSVGTAFTSTPVDLDALLAEADAHLYRHKRQRARS